ncbi:MAG TPA: TatD family hydrolase [Vicinamibacterales bacterium]|nr:TatD family hydrolase [Vicinamibacterales bacterium]
MVDSHCHLADDAFVKDLPDVVARARTAGLTHALCILAADNPVEAERAPELVRMWPALRFGIGLHPHQAGQLSGRTADVVPMVRRVITSIREARALGEIGLDYHYDFAPKDVQQDVFRLQIRLARELDLPIIIHTREAEDDTLAILREESGTAVRGVMHCFTGTLRLAEEALALGMHISFAGIVTFPKGTNVREVAAVVPADRLLYETDSPYLAPIPHRGKRNEPSWVVRVAEELATLRGVPLDDLRRQTSANFNALFRP